MTLLWFVLCLLSPGLAIGSAAVFYALHCKKRPDPERRIPALAYALLLLVCAIAGYSLGMIYGIEWACSRPAGNLCGLAGVFIAGPLVAAFAIFLVGGLILLLPADRMPESK
ncbi:MAG TPA: hypothetical protein VFK49_02750 [Stellaceae bacterium]|nr:hypothetical protein [Stellaceae bacterium]